MRIYVLLVSHADSGAATHPAIDYRIVPGSFPNPVVSVGV